MNRDATRWGSGRGRAWVSPRAAADGGDAAAALLRAGCRPTAQRLLVLRALASGVHVDADEVLAHARASYPSLDPSTVYRTLDALVEAGLALRSDLGAGRLHYEMARDHRHHHAVCQRCGGAPARPQPRPLAAALDADTGYLLSPDRELTIPGLRPRCRGDADERRETAQAHP